MNRFAHNIEYEYIHSLQSFEKYYKKYYREFEKRAQLENEILNSLKRGNKYEGWDILDEGKTSFKIPKNCKNIHFRESLISNNTNINARMRASLAMFKILTSNRVSQNLKIYFTEQCTNLFELVHRKKISNEIIGSEFLDKSYAPGHIVNGIRHEDLTNLSFKDEEFDILFSLEVLEHIPNYVDALSECFRVLKNDGIAIFSAPFLANKYDNLIRAKVKEDGSVHHILEPEYHGDPLSKDGVLCFQHFGWEIIDTLRELGFKEANVISTWSVDYGILGIYNLQWYAIK